MNSLKESPEKVKPYIAHIFYKLLVAYDQNFDQEKYELMLKVLQGELERYAKLNKVMLDKAYAELMKNFTTYRRVCPASYMTAFAKVNHK